MSFYPTSELTRYGPGLMTWAPPAMALLLAVLGYRLWTFGLPHDTGTGSECLPMTDNHRHQPTLITRISVGRHREAVARGLVWLHRGAGGGTLR